MSLVEDIFNKFSAGRIPNQDDFNAGKFFLLLKDPFGCFLYIVQVMNVSGEKDLANTKAHVTNL